MLRSVSDRPQAIYTLAWLRRARGEGLEEVEHHLLKLGVIDRVIPEPLGGAQRDPLAAIAEAGRAIAAMLAEFEKKAHPNLALDHGDCLVYIAPTRVNLSLTEERWPDVGFRRTREH